MVYFPISVPMAGSVIPGQLRPVRVVKIVNYPDHSSALKRRKAIADPVIKFPSMHEKLGTGHPVLEKLKALLSGRDSGPEMKEGYQPFVGTRNWRQS